MLDTTRPMSLLLDWLYYLMGRAFLLIVIDYFYCGRILFSVAYLTVNYFVPLMIKLRIKSLADR